ncbi:MAG TPA: tetratricopeptide repeat protein [Anaerolineae bacterium]|nr:tetratricopeptide repeat protein [Anaerolineae bacterium]
MSSLLARLRARQSRFDEARLNYHHAIKLSHHIGDRVIEARACSNLGYYFIEQGNWWRAEVLCWHALRIFEQLDHNHGRAHTENHLGILYIRQGFWDRAQAHLEQACALWRGMEDGSGLMLGYMNLGMLFNEMEHFDEALSYHHQALFYAEQAGEELIVGTIHMNTGNCLRLMGRFAEAETCCLKAKVIFDRFKNSVGQGLVLDNLGLIYLGQSRWSKAKSALEAAVEVWRNLQNRHNEIRAMTYLLEYALTTENERLARIWLAETEALLSRYDRAGTYQQLWQKVDSFRRSLKGSADGASCGEV